MKRNALYFSCLLALLLYGLAACRPETDDGETPAPAPSGYLNLPAHFPAPELPEDNASTSERVALGKRLFFDKILSRDSSVSCGSCHHQENAFSDPVAFSSGVEGRLSERNSMPLVNLAWHPHFFWDGGVPTLEQQVLAPIENPLEMDNTMAEVVRRLEAHPEYPALFDAAYGRGPDVYTVVRAIAAFERTLISAGSPYDRYLQGDSSALTPAQKRGLELFNSERAECFHCHAGPLQSDFSFQNNGLYLVYADSGRKRISQLNRDYGKFKVPSLRNVAVTAPYMHDGSIQTLDEALEHYMSGGQNGRFTSPLIRPFELSENEKQDIIQFLHALTDTSFLENPQFRP